MSFKTKFLSALKSKFFYALDVALMFAITLVGIVLMIKFIYSPNLVIGDSMQPTLNHTNFVGTLAVNKFADNIERNDIVLAKATSDEKSAPIIKRVVAVPGDTIEIKSNQLILNGEVLEEDYIYEPMVSADYRKTTLGESEYFLLGDNRNVSADSRTYGIISIEKIIGRVVITNPWIAFVIFLGVGMLFVFFASAIVEKFGFSSRLQN